MRRFLPFVCLGLLLLGKAAAQESGGGQADLNTDLADTAVKLLELCPENFEVYFGINNKTKQCPKFSEAVRWLSAPNTQLSQSLFERLDGSGETFVTVYAARGIGSPVGFPARQKIELFCSYYRAVAEKDDTLKTWFHQYRGNSTRSILGSNVLDFRDPDTDGSIFAVMVSDRVLMISNCEECIESTITGLQSKRSLALSQFSPKIPLKEVIGNPLWGVRLHQKDASKDMFSPYNDDAQNELKDQKAVADVFWVEGNPANDDAKVFLEYISSHEDRVDIGKNRWQAVLSADFQDVASVGDVVKGWFRVSEFEIANRIFSLLHLYGHGVIL